MKVLNVIFKIMDWIEEIMIVVLMLFMVSLNFVNVIARKLLEGSFSFTEELTIIAFVWVTMMGISAAYKRMSHLGMSFVVDRFPPKGQAFFCLFGMVCSLVLIVIMIVYGFDMIQGQIDMNAKTPAMMIPAWVQGLSIPVGAIFMGIRTIQASVGEAIRLWKTDIKEGGAA